MLQLRILWNGKKYRIKWKNIVIIALILYLIIGIIGAAIDSHKNPEKHKYCVINEIC